MRGTGRLLWMILLVASAALLWGTALDSAYAQEEKEKAGEVEKEKSAAPHTAKGEDHAKEHHGDPTDLTHANASRAIANPDELKADAAIATLVIFLLLMAILTKFAWKPIAHGLEAREKGIMDKIEQASVAAEKATEQLKQYEAKLAAATQEAQQIVGEARKTAETQKETILSEAQALAQREREKAVADISTAKNQALREIAETSVDTAIGLARNIIRREVRPGDHEQLIKDALKQFPNN
jgi:F-type H+-transporting ATPase subunit b